MSETPMPFGSFGNPIVGGGGELIRTKIRSRNYVPGVAGWAIFQDGTAEFSGVIIRGEATFGTPGGERVEISSTGVIRIYNAANELVVQLDDTGLLIQDATTGAYIYTTVAAGVTFQALQPPNVPGYVFGPGFSVADSDAGFGDAWMKMESPSINGGEVARVYVYGENTTHPTNPDSQIKLDAFNVYSRGDFPLGRNNCARAFDTVDSANVTAETTILTSTSFDYLPGRAYMAWCGPALLSSNANARAGFRFRKNNVAGQVLGGPLLQTPSAVLGNFCNGYAWAIFRNNTAANITCFIALTLQNFDGGANTSRQCIPAAGQKRFLIVQDIGDAEGWDFGTDLV